MGCQAERSRGRYDINQKIMTEIVVGSLDSFDDAIKTGFERACKTLRGITGVCVLEQRVKVADNKMIE